MSALGLGWRNIWRNSRRTLISMSAVGVGLALVIFYSSMVGGMLGSAKTQLDSAGMGHVEITATGFRPHRELGATMPDLSEWRGKLDLPPDAQVGQRVLARGLATSAHGSEAVQVWGVDWKAELELSSALRQLKSGALPGDDDAHGVVIGEQLAERLDLKVGSKLRLMAQRAPGAATEGDEGGDSEIGADLYRVRAIFHSVSPTIGKRQVFIGLRAGRDLLGLGAVSHQVVVQLAQPEEAKAVAARLGAALGPKYEALTWGQLVPMLERMEALTDSVVFVIAIFVYLLVGLGVMNTMLMSVLERTREFGVLLSLGTRPKQIVQLVLAESFWIATVSGLLGAAIGTFLAWHFSTHGVQISSTAESMELGGATLSTLVKTRFALSDTVKATSFVYVMALVVGLYPAWRITRLQPAEAVRHT
ncbi:MAG: FtsX-like permease family protein [Myxococcaceae bacterium]